MVQPSCSNQNAGDINSIVKNTDRYYANVSFSKFHQIWSSYLYRFSFNLPDYRNIPMCFLSGFLLKRLIKHFTLPNDVEMKRRDGDFSVSFAVKHTAKGKSQCLN